jgi:hypothetical protein
MAGQCDQPPCQVAKHSIDVAEWADVSFALALGSHKMPIAQPQTDDKAIPVKTGRVR